MKILFITDLYPIKSGEKTTSVALHNFVIEWFKLGHKVDVIKPNFILNSFLRGKPFYKTEYYKYEGVKIFNVNYFTPFWFDILNKLPQVNYSEYDVIVAHMPSGIIFANKLAKIISKPLICGVHISDIEVLTNPLYRFYFKSQMIEAYENAKKIACRSEVLQKKFGKILPELTEKTFVAASGINIKTEKKQIFCVDSVPIKVLTCANLIKRKNIDKLILAMDGLKDFELTVIGDGKEIKRLKNIRDSIDGNVKFTGRLPQDNVLEEMSKSDIFILPSVNESFGMVYLEAMASGCITVCSENDGIDGIIKDNENGFLTKPSVEGIKCTLLKIKNSNNKRKIIENSNKTLNEYSNESCAQFYLKNIN